MPHSQGTRREVEPVEQQARDAAVLTGAGSTLRMEGDDLPVVVPKHIFISVEDVRGHEEAVLWWEDGPELYGVRVEGQATAQRTCLKEFYRLVDATPEQIRAFALCHGVLGIWPLLQGDGVGSGQLFGDTINFWHRMARRVRAILRIKASLDLSRASLAMSREPDEPDEEDWREVFGQTYAKSLSDSRKRPLPTPVPADDLERARYLLFDAVSLWTRAVPMTLYLSWSQRSLAPDLCIALPDALSSDYEKAASGGAEARQHQPLHRKSLYWPAMRPSRLFHVLVWQLLVALRGRVVVCSICGLPLLDYKTKAGRPDYCPKHSLQADRRRSREGMQKMRKIRALDKMK